MALWTEGDPRSSVSHQELRAPKEGPETPPGLALGRCWAQGHLGFVGRVFRQQRIHQGTPVTCTERPPPSTVVNTPHLFQPDRRPDSPRLTPWRSWSRQRSRPSPLVKRDHSLVLPSALFNSFPSLWTTGRLSPSSAHSADVPSSSSEAPVTSSCTALAPGVTTNVSSERWPRRRSRSWLVSGSPHPPFWIPHGTPGAGWLLHRGHSGGERSWPCMTQSNA